MLKSNIISLINLGTLSIQSINNTTTESDSNKSVTENWFESDNISRSLLLYLFILKNSNIELINNIFGTNLENNEDKNSFINYCAKLLKVNILWEKYKNISTRSFYPNEIVTIVEYQTKVSEITDKLQKIYDEPNNRYKNYHQPLQGLISIFNFLMPFNAITQGINGITINGITTTLTHLLDNQIFKLVASDIEKIIGKIFNTSIKDASSFHLWQEFRKELENPNYFWNELKKSLQTNETEFISKLENEFIKLVFKWIFEKSRSEFCEGYKVPKQNEVKQDWRYTYFPEFLGKKESSASIAQLLLEIWKISAESNIYDKKPTQWQTDNKLSDLQSYVLREMNLTDDFLAYSNNFMDLFVKLIDRYNFWYSMAIKTQKVENAHKFTELEKRYINFRVVESLINLKMIFRILFKDEIISKNISENINSLIKIFSLGVADINNRDFFKEYQVGRDILNLIKEH
ncbi:hypothetical protein [Mycoplasma hafezii]|uniref:hypothetical protein n=1 Tax=Mycoplasma hafezii TaxID=525886 RepID=UPI003CEBC8C3